MSVVESIRLAQIDISQSPSDAWGGLYLDVMSAVYGADFAGNPPTVFSGHVAGTAVTTEMASEAFNKLMAEVPETAYVLRYEGDGLNGTALQEVTGAAAAATEVDDIPYIKMLHQVCFIESIASVM